MALNLLKAAFDVREVVRILYVVSACGNAIANSENSLMPVGRLSHYKAELEQFDIDARRTPKPVLHAHPSDQGAQIGIDPRPASAGSETSSANSAESLHDANARRFLAG